MRLIDADALIAQWESDAEEMEEMVFKLATYGAINDVKHQPTIEPEQQWIPCSERLPETNVENEIGTMGEVVGQYKISAPVLAYVRGMDEEINMTVAWYEDDMDGRTGWITAPDCMTVDVVAWMPLPEGYKG